MKAYSILFGSFVPGALLAVGSALLFTPAAQAQTTVLHTFTETFDSLNAGLLHGQGGWLVSNDNSARQYGTVRSYGDDNKVFRIALNAYAYRSVTKADVQVNTLSLSWTQRALLADERTDLISGTGGGTWNNMVGGVELMSGTQPYNDPLFSILIQRNEYTDNYKQMLLYSQWDASEGKYTTIYVPRSGEGSFVPSNSITYAFSVMVNLEAATYSFTISDAADASIIWTSPEAIAIKPGPIQPGATTPDPVAFPNYLRLRAQGGNAGGVVFDNVVFQQLHVTAIPEPAAFAMMAGAALLGFAVVRRRR